MCFNGPHKNYGLSIGLVYGLNAKPYNGLELGLELFDLDFWTSYGINVNLMNLGIGPHIRP